MAILARDKPLHFFVAGFFCLFLLIFLVISILAIIWNYGATEPKGAWEILTVMIAFMPILPIFFPLFLMFIEWYFNLVRMGWIIGLDKKPFLRWFLRWAGVEQAKQEF